MTGIVKGVLGEPTVFSLAMSRVIAPRLVRVDAGTAVG